MTPEEAGALAARFVNELKADGARSCTPKELDQYLIACIEGALHDFTAREMIPLLSQLIQTKMACRLAREAEIRDAKTQTMLLVLTIVGVLVGIGQLILAFS